MLPGNDVRVAARGAVIAFLQASSLWAANGGSQISPFGITWSLAIEWYFYLIWPLAIVSLRKTSGLRAAGTCLIGSFVVYVLSLGTSPHMFYFGPMAHFSELLVGAAVAYLLASKVSVPKFRSGVRAGMAGLLVLFLIGWTILGPDEFANGYRVVVPVLSVIAAWLIVIGYWFPRDLLARILSSQVLSRIGLVSYSLYLWHSVPMSLLHHDSFGLSQPALAGIGLFMVFGITAMGYLFLERPFQRGRAASIMA